MGSRRLLVPEAEPTLSFGGAVAGGLSGTKCSSRTFSPTGRRPNFWHSSCSGRKVTEFENRLCHKLVRIAHQNGANHPSGSEPHKGNSCIIHTSLHAFNDQKQLTNLGQNGKSSVRFPRLHFHQQSSFQLVKCPETMRPTRQGTRETKKSLPNHFNKNWESWRNSHFSTTCAGFRNAQNRRARLILISSCI